MKNKYRNSDSAIRAGDLILTEQPFAFVLSSKEKGNWCDNCFEKGKVLKCSGCQFVHYCGRSCQKDAWPDHKWECGNLKRVAPKVIPDAARMLAKIINKLSRADGHSHRAFYSGTSFRMWKDLMSHYPDLKADKRRMEHLTSLCGVLYEFLKDLSLPNTVELMGLYGRMVINSFTILDTDMNSIGTGVYLAASILDHSCNPNAVATFDGKTIFIRATKDMPCLDWSQIRISYIDLMKTPYERQSELLENYYFLCQCDRCMDENQLKMVHAAKCLNISCDNPVTISWKENCQLVRGPEKQASSSDSNRHNDEVKTDVVNGQHNANSDVVNGQHNVNNDVINGQHNANSDVVNSQHNENSDVANSQHKANGDVVNGQNGFVEELSDTKDIGITDDVVRCTECSTKYTDKCVEQFTKAMQFTELHLQNMKEASVAYVDVCKYCLERQEGVLHPLNVMHAQTLDHAFDALVQVELWQKACEYAERLIPCFRFYYGDRHPLLGLLHLKYGKILLYIMDIEKALNQFKSSEKILKITHGDKHPLYREQLLPLLRQAMIEASH